MAKTRATSGSRRNAASNSFSASASSPHPMEPQGSIVMYVGVVGRRLERGGKTRQRLFDLVLLQEDAPLAVQGHGVGGLEPQGLVERLVGGLAPAKGGQGQPPVGMAQGKPRRQHCHAGELAQGGLRTVLRHHHHPGAQAGGRGLALIDGLGVELQAALIITGLEARLGAFEHRLIHGLLDPGLGRDASAEQHGRQRQGQGRQAPRAHKIRSHCHPPLSSRSCIVPDSPSRRRAKDPSPDARRP